MTKVEITIQEGKITWAEFKGDELPEEVKAKILIALDDIF